MCGRCKRVVKHKPYGGPHRWHGCRLRWIARRVAQAECRGWSDGYRFALDNVSDPMVYADISDYGSGWAGLVERGGIVIEGHDVDTYEHNPTKEIS
jgi:hypothetical protein